MCFFKQKTAFEMRISDWISDVCSSDLRDPADVKLISISKTHPADAILPLIHAGQRVFGENRVQEAQAKWPELKAVYADVELHLVGQIGRASCRERVCQYV